jgi:hypothetical protein
MGRWRALSPTHAATGLTPRPGERFEPSRDVALRTARSQKPTAAMGSVPVLQGGIPERVLATLERTVSRAAVPGDAGDPVLTGGAGAACSAPGHIPPRQADQTPGCRGRRKPRFGRLALRLRPRAARGADRPGVRQCLGGEARQRRLIDAGLRRWSSPNRAQSVQLRPHEADVVTGRGRSPPRRSRQRL